MEKNEPRVDSLIKFYKKNKSDRMNFESFWQSLHDYFYIEAPDVNRSYAPGSELNSEVLFDSTTLECADVLASGFMNYLTPPTSKWFALRPKDKNLTGNKVVGTYLEIVADAVNDALNKSNFYNEIINSYKGSGVYGTSIVIEEDDIADDVRFYSMPVKQVVIIEDGRGRVSEYFVEFEYTASQAASRWGAEKLATSMQEELVGEKRVEKKHQFLLYIGYRQQRDVRKTDKLNLPVEATWIDLENKKTVDEGGYNEFPAFTHRFNKRPFIAWGYSPAMKALPFARILNAIAKTNLRAMMKHTDPPLAVPDNAFIMPFNANPRAVNYYNKTKMEGSKDIFSFGNYGDPNAGITSIEFYSQKVKGLMFNDVFLAFEGLTKRMGNPEVMERINEKMTLLGPAVGRYISEILNPLIIRTIGILFRKGKLPPPPDEMRFNPEYEIDCISQLAQAQRRSELNALVSGLTMVGQMAQLAPDVMDKVSPDRTVDEIWSITGAPVRVLREDSEVQAIREGRQKMLAEQQQMMTLEQGANVLDKGAKANLNLTKSQEGNA